MRADQWLAYWGPVFAAGAAMLVGAMLLTSNKPTPLRGFGLAIAIVGVVAALAIAITDPL